MDKPDSIPERLERAANTGAPAYYANGFMTALGTGDVVIILQRNNDDVAVVNVSYTVAKSISASLGILIAEIESRSGREIMTSNDIEHLFLENVSKGKENAMALPARQVKTVKGRKENR